MRKKRLHAIREFTELGSGFKIAMRDLEIRGAGNLLGAEQSGHMESVGYDLYCKMLSEAVQEAKGIEVAEDFETTIDMSIDAYLPDSYISNEALKLDTYKRIAAIENSEEYDDMLEELLDRFGEPPRTVQNLLAVANLKALAHKAWITEIKQMQETVRITMHERAKLDVNGIPGVLERFGRVEFQDGKARLFVFRPRKRNTKERSIISNGRRKLWKRCMNWFRKTMRRRRNETVLLAELLRIVVIVPPMERLRIAAISLVECLRQNSGRKKRVDRNGRKQNLYQ